MALSEETKQRIGLEYQDKTLKQLATENNCSVSSVQRVIKSTIAEQEKMKQDHAAQSKDGAGAGAGAGDTTDAFTFTPDASLDQKEVIELDSDPHMNSLLSKLPERDPFAEAVGDDAAPATDAPAEQAAPAPVPEQPQPDPFDQKDAQLDSLIESLGIVVTA